MTVDLVSDVPDSTAYVRDTVTSVLAHLEHEARILDDLLARPKARVAAGAPGWDVQQVALHLYVVERGVIRLTLQLARGEAPGETRQPRPREDVTPEALAAWSEKAAQARSRLRLEFPVRPNLDAVAAHPYFGDLNSIGWLLTLYNHGHTHLAAIRAT